MSSFVKPDPKPIEKTLNAVPLIKAEIEGQVSNSSNEKEKRNMSFHSPKCLTNEQMKNEPIGK